jgi:YfiH family protein
MPLANLTDKNIVYAFSTRIFKNMSLSYGDTTDSLSNRMNFLAGLDIDYRNLVCAKQIHASSIRYATQKDKGRGALSYDDAIPDTDGFMTDKRNLPLAIFTADCLSIFLYDPRTPAIGIIHAGWRSTKENITVKAVQLMQEKFNTRAFDLCAWLGPAIRSCCYEVGSDFNKFFSSGLIEKNKRYYLDLPLINKKQLLGLGVKEDNISDPGICTSCRNNEFFSFRKEGENCGRIMSVIMLK